jgi:hypothetical protein
LALWKVAPREQHGRHASSFGSKMNAAHSALDNFVCRIL